jgi:hypothetical protein
MVRCLKTLWSSFLGLIISKHGFAWEMIRGENHSSVEENQLDGLSSMLDLISLRL